MDAHIKRSMVQFDYLKSDKDEQCTMSKALTDKVLGEGHTKILNEEEES